MFFSPNHIMIVTFSDIVYFITVKSGNLILVDNIPIVNSNRYYKQFKLNSTLLGINYNNTLHKIYSCLAS